MESEDIKKYLIVLTGCDDETECEIELTEKEMQKFIEIAKKVNKKSTCGCQPTISVYDNYGKKYEYFKHFESKDLAEE